jgi:hypothetical protein
MQPIDLFAHLVRELAATLLDGHTLSLEDRVGAVSKGLGVVLATAPALPCVPGETPPFGSSPLTEWPGFGSFEDYWRETDEGPVPMRLTDTLTFVFQQLWTGLEHYEAGETERAAGTWGAGYASTWGPASLELITQLHPRVVGYRSDRMAVRRGPRRAAPLVMVAHRKETSPPDRPTLGLRISPVPGGVAIVAVHPRGPAAGVLEVDDIVLAVEGHPLDGLSEADAGAALTGPVGTTRRYEVYRDGETLLLPLTSVGVQTL